MLVGYTDPVGAQVVTSVIGPGPAAQHSRQGFVPDHNYQQHRLDDLYADSARVYTYLGDWHSHPRGAQAPSKKDRRVLRRVARTLEARCRTPLMGIATTDDDDTVAFHVWEFVPSPRLSWVRSNMASLGVKEWDQDL